MTSVEFLVVFSVAAFDFAVVFRRKGSDQLMHDTELRQHDLVFKEAKIYTITNIEHTIHYDGISHLKEEDEK